MNNKTLALTLLSMMLLIVSIPMVSAHNAPFTASNNMVIDTIGDPETMDPAWAYDTASAEVISNVYETLFSMDVDYAGKYPIGAGSTDVFNPTLTEPIGTTANQRIGLTIERPSTQSNPLGGLYDQTWYFKMRTSPAVTFHNGQPLTAADVEYSFEREMIQDRDGGPQWMIFEPLLEEYFADGGPDGGVKIDNAVESNSTHVWFNLVAPYPELGFKQILSQSWSSVVEMDWAVGRLDFDGNWAADWETVIFPTWHNPAVSFLDSPNPDMVGTGPYMFSFWNSQQDYSVVRNTGYWQGWPAPASSTVGGGGDTTTLGGYIETITWRELGSWTVRRGNFLAGSADFTVVPRSYRDQVLGQIVGGEKIRNNFPIAPILSASGMFFTFDVSTSSQYAGVMNAPGVFTSAGIPPDIFNDILVRKGFAYAFNYNAWLALAMLNEGTQPADPVIPGLAYDNVANNKYNFDLAKAEYFLRLSWGGADDGSGIQDPSHIVTNGALWNGGMKMSVVYNIGNVPRELASQEIVNEVNSLNSLFALEPLGLDWGTQVLPAMVASELPLFHIGWLADYADPHDFVFPFQHTFGTFSAWQRYSSQRVDDLIVAGIATPDDTAPYNGELDAGDPRPLFDTPGGIPPDSRWPRRSIYYELQALWFDDVPTVLYIQGIGRHFEQAWVRGWYTNALYPGGIYYHYWKALTHFGDVSSSGIYGIADGAVNTFDAGFISAHWTDPISVYGYHVVGDINGGVGGTTGGLTGPVRGMSDGVVDIVDLGLVSAYFDSPQGPSHP